jgi:hypothetical protein
MADKKPEDKIDSDVIVSALQFWKKIYDEKDVIIKFEKKDKTERIMRCTLDFDKIPQQDKPKNVNIQQILKLIQKNKIMHVYDLDKKAWRSVPFERVDYMDTKHRRYYTKKYKTGRMN